MSKPVSRAAMPPEALHSATATPMIKAVSDPAAERPLAELTASLNTVAAPGGSALSRPLTSRVTVAVPRCRRLVRPSRAISAGNRARNQW
jgi:hypothetical protein